MNRADVAQWGVVLGAVMVAVGFWWLLPALGMIVGGAGAVWFFLMVFDVDGGR